jgi:hypothetical protein
LTKLKEMVEEDDDIFNYDSSSESASSPSPREHSPHYHTRPYGNDDDPFDDVFGVMTDDPFLLPNDSATSFELPSPSAEEEEKEVAGTTEQEEWESVSSGDLKTPWDKPRFLCTADDEDGSTTCLFETIHGDICDEEGFVLGYSAWGAASKLIQELHPDIPSEASLVSNHSTPTNNLSHNLEVTTTTTTSFSSTHFDGGSMAPPPPCIPMHNGKGVDNKPFAFQNSQEGSDTSSSPRQAPLPQPNVVMCEPTDQFLAVQPLQDVSLHSIGSYDICSSTASPSTSPLVNIESPFFPPMAPKGHWERKEREEKVQESKEREEKTVTFADIAEEQIEQDGYEDYEEEYNCLRASSSSLSVDTSSSGNASNRPPTPIPPMRCIAGAVGTPVNGRAGRKADDLSLKSPVHNNKHQYQ